VSQTSQGRTGATGEFRAPSGSDWSPAAWPGARAHHDECYGRHAPVAI